MAEHSLGTCHRVRSRHLTQEIAKFSQGLAYQIAEVYAWRGEKDKAFEWLDRAYAQRDGGLSFIKADPLLASAGGRSALRGFPGKDGLAGISSRRSRAAAGIHQSPSHGFSRAMERRRFSRALASKRSRKYAVA